MKMSLLIFSFFLVGCSSMQPNCNGSKNWFDEGRNSYPGNAETTISNLQKNCEDKISLESLTQFTKGRDHQALVICTGSENFPKTGWRALGEEVALRGEAEAEYLNLKSKCNLSPTSDDIKEYKSAYQQSLLSLCSKVGGMEFARKELSYKSTCPKNMEKDFFIGNKVGLKMKEADEINADIKKLNEEIDELQKENVKNENITSLCQDKISLAGPDGKIDYRYDECSVSSVRDAQFKLSQSKRVIRENNVKLLDLKQGLSRRKDRLEQKYKEIEVINNLLKN